MSDTTKTKTTKTKTTKTKTTKTKEKGITVYRLVKQYTDAKTSQMTNQMVSRAMIHEIVDDDADGYGEDGKLLFVFRKNKLPPTHVTQFYDNAIDFAQTVSTNRFTASGSTGRTLKSGTPVMTNIMGYFDSWGARQKWKFKTDGVQTPLAIRETRFNIDHPENYQKIIPLIQDIDRLYKQYVPKHHAEQQRMINQTPFNIPGTSFTTVTTNVNFQTRIHTDRGDTPIGFGNLAVIEHGTYTGGETCFPQYGVGINVRTGDILFMDVHQCHGNLPLKLGSADAKRLSIVCYLRQKVWEKSRGKSRKFMITHNKTVRRLLGKQ